MDIPGYKIESELHRGEKYIVFLATKLSSNQKVTLKTFIHDPLTEYETSKLKQEYEICEYLTLPGVLQILGLENYRNLPVIVSEYFEGISLKEYILYRNLNVKDFLKLSITLSQNIGEIHDNSIIHKDIKPSNIIVSKDLSVIKITDFGISTRLRNETFHNSNLESLEGTLAYISPEQTGRMNRSIDSRSDLYSLGVSLYELLTGRLPFEMGDPLELLHSHIAVKPDSPNDLDLTIPKPISNIIMKLLEKNAEDRYQSAFGLKKDLEICLDALYNNKLDNKFNFNLGEFDFSGRLQEIKKVYGREKELKLLLSEFEKVPVQNKKELILISGHSGIGKSALVNEFINTRVISKHIPLVGKFEEYKKNNPYSGFKEAINELCKHLISLDPVEIENWKSKLLNSLGNNGKVLIDIFPEIEWIIGEQPEPPTVDALEAHNRFNTTFQAFLNTICSSEKPAVLFLDDLQWADDSSLYLLFHIMTDVEISNILIIINWQSNEIHDSDPIKVTIEIIKKGRAPVIEFDLSPITLENTEMLLVESLNLEISKVTELAEIIYRKTEGNPFFITEFLKTIYDEQILYFDFRKRNWIWDVTKIKSHKLSESIVEIVVSKLNKFPLETMELLSLCSFYGNQFELQEIANITGKEFTEIIQILWKPIEEGLIEPLDNNYKLLRLFAGLEKANSFFKFQHERIRMVAYNRIPKEDKDLIHLKIARSISTRTPIYKIEEKIFEIVNHYNLTINKLTDEFEKVKLVEYNILAGKKALLTNSYGLAIRYFEAGKSCLPEDAWSSHAEITMELMKSRAEAEFLNGNYQSSLKLIEEILGHSNVILDRLDAKTLLLTQYNIVGEYEDALIVGGEALELLNIELPVKDYVEKVKSQISEINDYLRNKKINSLLNSKVMEDREVLAAMKILSRIKSTAYLYKVELYPWIVTKMVNLSLRYGNSPESCFAFATYGIILGSQFENYIDAYEFAWVGYRLSEKINNKAQKCKSGYILANYISPWKDNLKESIKINEDSYKSGIESGELQFAGYAYAFKLISQVHCGFRVQDVIQEIRSCITFCKKTQNNWITDLLNGIYLVVSNLSRNNPEPSNYSVDNLNESVFLKDCETNSSTSAICIFYIFKAYSFYLYELPEESLMYIEKAKEKIGSILGQYEFALVVFLHSLLLCELYPKVSSNEQLKYLEDLKKNQVKLEIWAKNCPSNFWVMYSLVEVEVQKITLMKENLIETYESIIEKAKEYGFPNLEVIANKLTFKYVLQKGNKKLIRLYLEESIQGFKTIGHKAIVSNLENKYSDYLIYGKSNIDKYKLEGTSSGLTASINLDLYTAIKASQAIAIEFKLENLIKKVLEVVVESTGAERGVLVLYNDQKRTYTIEGEISSNKEEILQSIPLIDAKDIIPEKIIRYSLKTKSKLILKKAYEDGNFKSDPYIINNKVQSVMSLPLIHRGILKGSLYLENNLSSNVFTEDRFIIIELIMGQAALSIHNSLMYEKLEDLVEERTLKLQNTLEQVRKLKIQQDCDYFLLGELLEPFGLLDVNSSKFKLDKYVVQKKKFEFKKYKGEIGGDIVAGQKVKINNRNYIIFINGDAMGKSSQGAGGVLVFGSLFEAILYRTRNQLSSTNISIAQWLTKTFLELNQVFSRFKGSMLISVILGALDEETGELYFINADHPRPVIYRDNKASFLGRIFSHNKLGTGDEMDYVRVGKFKMEKGDIIICGSDGKDNLGIGIDEDGRQIVNFDNDLFKTTVELSNGEISSIVDKLKMDGELIDDLSLLRIEFL